MIKAIKEKRKHAIKLLLLTVLVGVLSGAEAVIALGIELPFSKDVPGWLRAVLIVGVTMGAFVARHLQARALAK